MIRIIIGTEYNQYLPQKVLEYSIKKSAKHPVEIQAIHQEDPRKGGTNFGFVRFNVPSLCGYEGRAIYLDADQLVLSDIGELFDILDSEHAIALVNQPEGFFGGKPVGQHNQTSVMVLDCAKLKHWDPKTLFANVIPNDDFLSPGQIHYRDFMMLAWERPELVQALPSYWNHFNVVRPESKLVHFSFVRSQPWKSPNHPLTEFWAEWLSRAIKDGAVSPKEVLREVLKGHVHRSFLRYLLPGPRVKWRRVAYGSA